MNRSTAHIRKDVALLIIRVAIGGSMLAFHGIPKLIKDPENREKIGSAMHKIGITFMTSFWGFSAMLAESVGAALIILGLFTRPTSLILAFTMLIATITHLANGDGIIKASHPMELMFVFIALAIAGAGKYSIDKK